MGGSLCSTYVWSNDQRAVIEAVKAIGRGGQEGLGTMDAFRLRRAFVRDRYVGSYPVVFVSPSIDGWVGVYDAWLEGTDYLIPDLACGLSQALGTTGLTLHLLDGDRFSFCLANHGQIVFETYADDDEVLAPGLDTVSGGWGELVESIVGGDLSGHERFEKIAGILGLPNRFVTHRRLLEESRVHRVDKWSDFVILSNTELHNT